MTPTATLAAIEQAHMALRAGEIDAAQYVRAVEAALRAWRGMS